MEKKAAVYCRLSREDEGLDEDAHSESIVNQQKLLCDYAQKNGFCIYCIYVDENYSGLDNCRPAFCRLIEDAQHGRFQTILCKNQSRFTRDMETAEHYLNELFPLWGIRFIGVCDRTDTDDEKNRRMRQINGLVNEWYSEDLSDNIRQILHDKMQRGQFIGSFACYGYTKDPSDPHRLIPDPPAALTVREIYRLYLEGFSLRQIADYLTQRQLPPPCRYKIQQGFLFQTPFSPESGADTHICKWASSSVRRILTNPVYTGTLIQGTSKKESAKSSRRIPVAREEWAIYPHAHPALISEEAFCQVQILLKRRRKKK